MLIGVDHGNKQIKNGSIANPFVSGLKQSVTVPLDRMC